MNILFTLIDMKGLHGSLVHTLEYAEYFISRGDKVTVASPYIHPDVRSLAETKGIKVCFISRIPEVRYDLIYALHLILFPGLVSAGLKFGKAIFSSLSSFETIEAPPPVEFWNQYALMTVHSEESLVFWKEKYGLNPNAFLVIPNAIPPKFKASKVAKSSWSPTLKKVCVVSNHYVKEVVELNEIAPFLIDFYGAPYKRVTPITPELLLNYDAIITIGKTVQYGLGQGIPVFEYDRFGGCGYISLENMAQEEKTNFSGRGTGRRLSSVQLGEELLLNYNNAIREATALRERAIARYALDAIIERQLKIVSAKPKPPRLVGDGLLFANAAHSAIKYMCGNNPDDGLR